MVIPAVHSCMFMSGREQMEPYLMCVIACILAAPMCNAEYMFVDLFQSCLTKLLNMVPRMKTHLNFSFLCLRMRHEGMSVGIFLQLTSGWTVPSKLFSERQDRIKLNKCGQNVEPSQTLTRYFNPFIHFLLIKLN